MQPPPPPAPTLAQRLRRAVRRAAARFGGEPGVDVVVPVHDGRADVERCLASVVAHATGEVRVVVVDDASTDPALVRFLDELARRDPRVVLLRNEANLGFVRSANRGMRAAGRRDVLLLNSDTEVPPEFLERLRAAARHTPRTGIVSPLTNNGTILSVPEFMLDNPLPHGFDVTSFDALIAATSARERPEIFTAHGFCMLVRRAVLDAVGYFDEAFGRGYGEENDLCERAKAAGFEIRACDDLFVWHRGSASFDAEAEPLRAANLEVLGRRHPGYHEGVQRFIRTNPLAGLHANVRFQLARAGRRRAPALLFVLHADPFADPRTEPVGGTQLHVVDLARALAAPRAVIAWPEGRTIRAVELADGDPASALAFRFAAPDGDAAASASVDRFALRDPVREAAFERLLDVLDVGAAHLHHLSGWPAAVWRALAARSTPFACTVHDYLCTCPSFYRLDLETLAPCGCAEAGAAQATRCLAAFHRACGLAPPADATARIAEHRAEHGALLAAASAVIVPSHAAQEIVARAFPGGALRWHVIPHARPVEPIEPAGPLEQLDEVLGAGAGAHTGAARELRVALLGAPAAPWKGAGVVLEAMRATRDLPLAWHVFGDAGAFGFPERAADALGATSARLHLRGRYERSRIAQLLRDARAHVVLIPSPWPETFSYTLSEAWAAGVPAIVLDRGAPAARVRAMGAGLVAADVAEIIAALQRLVDEPELRRTLARAAAAAARHEPTATENAALHRAAYGAEMLARLVPRRVASPFGAHDRALFAAHRAASSAAQPNVTRDA